MVATIEEYLPAGQSAQLMPDVYWPAGQDEPQAEDPAEAKVPAPQAEHDTAPAAE